MVRWRTHFEEFVAIIKCLESVLTRQPSGSPARQYLQFLHHHLHVLRHVSIMQSLLQGVLIVSHREVWTHTINWPLTCQDGCVPPVVIHLRGPRRKPGASSYTLTSLTLTRSTPLTRRSRAAHALRPAWSLLQWWHSHAWRPPQSVCVFKCHFWHRGVLTSPQPEASDTPWCSGTSATWAFRLGVLEWGSWGVYFEVLYRQT